ncbi:efflux RND transporter periplasmic adaptor subunit [Nonlabens ponticola]|uniref:HlyD family efflux transporter periplasmic adaptor subunit n=1 Tax=Nonlabens ponticola TaxID=2496866 RepID=A0A3S9MU78_9FLAO|nr:HlyD family efflux transporter periplasmic adaptor subunit [Nonlabens ponticola]AZQ42721.1 HlyD family efflux transporter periplasmic adaptor subunit [Nonlabens ponticola]
MRKTVLSIVGVVLVIAAVAAAYFIVESKEKPQSKVKEEIKIVETDTVQNSTVPIIIPANGNLTAKRRVELFSEVTGVFRPVNKLFRTGQAYSAGEAMIRIDNTEFYAQVQSSRTSLYNQIAAIMADLRLDYPESFSQWQSYLDNWNLNNSTPALPQPVNDREKYFITNSGINATYYNIKNLERRLGKFVMTAPFTGVLTEAMVTEGTLVRNGQQLGEFIATGTYELQVAISGEFADLLQVGETVMLENTSGTQTYVGKVTRVNAKIDPSSQTITTVIEVSHPDLKQGMYVKARLNVQQIENAVELDRSLLQQGNSIFTVVDGRLDLVKIDPVFYTDETVVIKGLDDNTVIINKVLSGAYQDMKVQTQEQATRKKTQDSIAQARES